MSRFSNPQAQPPARQPLGQAQGQHSQLDQDPQSWPQTAGRPAARPPQQPAPQQNFGGRAPQPAPYGQPQQPNPYAQPAPGYAQPGYDAGGLDPFAALRNDQAHDPYQYNQQPDAFGGGQYALPQQPQPAALSTYQPRPAPAPQSYEPFGQTAQTYTPPGAYGTPQQPSSFDTASPFDNWSATQPHADTRDYGAGYGNAAPAEAYDAYQQQPSRAAAPAGSAHWVGQDHYAQLGMEPSFDGTGAPYGQAAQPQAGGAFEQTYAEDEANYAEPPRRGWTRIAVLLASTVLLGGGLAYAYNALLGGGPSGGTPPVVKSAEGPFKVKPSDPGGKQFAHADSKVMGRLGDGSATETSSTTPSSDVDASGARKVPVLVVSRDGTIQPPAAPSDEAAAPQAQAAPQQRASVSVPGLTVIDSFGAGGPRPQPSTSTVTTTASVPPSRPLVVSPPAAAPVKPKVIAAATPTTLNDSGPADSEPAPPKKPAAKKTAAVTPTATPSGLAGPAPSGAGYVAVLASVPASASSRIDALKQFADMQQKYGTILQNKTPDVQEANLGEKGTYHRLLVGPPGSRDSASQLCTELKGQGYSNCWVTAY